MIKFNIPLCIGLLLLGGAIGYMLHGNKTSDTNSLIDSVNTNKVAAAVLEGEKNIYASINAKIDSQIITRDRDISNQDEIRRSLERKISVLAIKPITNPDSAYLYLKRFMQ